MMAPRGPMSQNSVGQYRGGPKPGRRKGSRLQPQATPAAGSCQASRCLTIGKTGARRPKTTSRDRRQRHRRRSARNCLPRAPTKRPSRRQPTRRMGTRRQSVHQRDSRPVPLQTGRKNLSPDAAPVAPLSVNPAGSASPGETLTAHTEASATADVGRPPGGRQHRRSTSRRDPTPSGSQQGEVTQGVRRPLRKQPLRSQNRRPGPYSLTRRRHRQPAARLIQLPDRQLR